LTGPEAAEKEADQAEIRARKQTQGDTWQARHLPELLLHCHSPRKRPYLLLYLHLQHQLDYIQGREVIERKRTSKGQQQRLKAGYQNPGPRVRYVIEDTRVVHLEILGAGDGEVLTAPSL
jgi:hypothetical protein